MTAEYRARATRPTKRTSWNQGEDLDGPTGALIGVAALVAIAFVLWMLIAGHCSRIDWSVSAYVAAGQAHGPVVSSGHGIDGQGKREGYGSYGARVGR